MDKVSRTRLGHGQQTRWHLRRVTTTVLLACCGVISIFFSSDATLRRLKILLTCAAKNAPIFATVAAVCVVVAVSIVATKSGRHSTWESRVGSLSWYAHVSPLLIAPVLVSESLVRVSELEFPGSKDSVLLFGVLSLAFHSFLGVVILERVLGWTERVQRYNSIRRNLAEYSSLIKVGVFLSVLGPPLAVLFVVIWIFSESMVSAPFFTGRETLVSLSIEFSNSSVELAQQLPLIGFVLLLPIAGLVAAWRLPLWVGRKILTTTGRRLRRADGDRGRYKRPGIIRLRLLALKKIPIAISSLSGAVHLAVAFVAIIGLMQGAIGKATSYSDGIVSRIGSTFVTDAMICGVIAACFLLGSARLFILERCLLKEESELRGVEYVALAPPALIGLLGLCLTFAPVHKVVYFTVLGLYAGALVLFLSDTHGLQRSLMSIKNAQGLRLARRKIIKIGALSRWGTLSWPLAVALYLLWLEDGIQVSLDQNSESFAQFVRGLKISLPTPEAYRVALLSFFLWLLVFAVAYFVASRRVSLLLWRSRRRSSQPKRAYLWILPIILCGGTSSVDGQIQSSEAPAPLAIRVHGEFLVDWPSYGGSRAHIPRLEVHTPGSVVVPVPPTVTEIRIEELVFYSRGTRLELRGSGRQGLRKLEIEALRSDGGSNVLHTPELRVDGLLIDRFELRGAHDIRGGFSMVDIVFSDDASVERVLLAAIDTPRLWLNMNNSLGSDFVASRIRIGEMILKGMATASLEAETYLKLDLFAGSFYPNQQAELQFSNLRLGSGEVSVQLEDPAGPSGDNGSTPGVNARFKDLIIAKPSSSFVLSIGATRANSAGREESGATVTIDQVELAGTLGVYGSALDLVRVDGVEAPGAKREGVLNLHVQEIGSLQILDLGIRELSLCVDEPTPTTQVQDVRYSGIKGIGLLKIHPDLLRQLDPKFDLPLERLHFYENVQNNGVYCDGSGPVGLDARYFRKRADLEAISPTLSVVMNALTGFGVRPRVPMITMIILVSCILAARIGAGRLTSSLRDRPFKVRDILGTLTSSPRIVDEDELAETSRCKLAQLRYLVFLEYLLCIALFIQITVCSVYFSQTTLQ